MSFHVNPTIQAERDAIIIQRYNEGWGSKKIAGYIGVAVHKVKSREEILVKDGKLVRRK